MRALLALGLCFGASMPSAPVFDGTAQEPEPTPEPALELLTGDARAEFFREVEERMAAQKAVVATFEQEKHLALFEQPLRASGVILFSTPDRLRWELRAPFPSILVVSGQDVARFDHDAGTWSKAEQGRQADVILVVMDSIRTWFRGRFDPKEGPYEVEVARAPAPTIVLRPRGKALGKNLKAVELRLAPDLSHVARVTIREGNGDRTVMEFTRVARENLPLPAELFSLEQVAEADIEALRTR